MTNNKHVSSSDKKKALLWGAVLVSFIALLFARAVFSEYFAATVVVALCVCGAIGALIYEYRKQLTGRSGSEGLNAVITALLVIGLVGILNLVNFNHSFKADLTKNRVHTLSDQSEKLVKGLKKEVKAVYFGKLQNKEQARPLLDNLHALNNKFDVEYVDPDKEPTRARQVGIKKYGTLQLLVNAESGPRDQKIEEVNEEKVTNALIKLLKDKPQTICSISGHGEKSIEDTGAEGFDTAKKQLVAQSYDVKSVNLIQDAKDGKVPEYCDAILILGPQKAFFPNEIKAIGDYLESGGRAVIAVDINIKGGEFAPELLALLEKWHVKAEVALIVDPLSRMMGVDAAVPVIASYSKESPITKDFQANSYFPFCRPLEILPNAPKELKVAWLAQTTPKSWAEKSLTELAKGAVQFEPGKDKQGPLNAAITIDGKLPSSKSTKNSRIVVFGTSFFATNNYSRFGGNLDFFLNSLAWTVEDESLISIRAKEEGPGRVELSPKQGSVIFLISVILAPLAVAVAGIVIWAIRRRM